MKLYKFFPLSLDRGKHGNTAKEWIQRIKKQKEQEREGEIKKKKFFYKT